MSKGLDKGLVRRILPFSSVDGPGNRTAIFLQGCNFNCLYCHNPETITLKDAEAVTMSIDEILEEIKKVQLLYRRSNNIWRRMYPSVRFFS